MSLTVDGERHEITVDNRTTLLDALRDRLAVTSVEKGCGHGQCGSCTVLEDGRRVTTCLSLAVAHDGAEVTTARGLAEGGLHPVQSAFVEYDALQCGYCTPGQVCSAVGMLDELSRGTPSVVTEELTEAPEPTDEELRERLSGNLCRCGAYRGILDAVRSVATANRDKDTSRENLR
ncbi:(2Fe-2S)-binding protein [Rhodococcus rhodnii]|uniref:(2Fe-2S)-binding protein n=1 Tax=Rhodococcus rhodnii TaxID=38312 RepID=A0A6P2CJL4_9NOCA|nr:(2Fe-2S)-binding protein [Rhodococcus rhodnii]